MQNSILSNSSESRIIGRMKHNYTSITQPLIERAVKHPDHTSIIFIEQDSAKLISASQFNQRAYQHALALESIGIVRGDLIILVLQHSEELLSAFWGALYLGAIPSIFPFLTEKLDPPLYLDRVEKLTSHSGAKAIITYPEFKGQLTILLSGLDCEILSTDEVPNISDADYSHIDADARSSEDIAFLQHSSGTTGLQKGVALSHRAVINQITSYSQAINLSHDDIIASWLPLYHDMGLIAGFVMPLVTGIPLVLMSPFEWVRKPYMLLQVIDKYKATLCWLPNFAFNLIARTARPQFLEGVDLRHWRAAINCSEPILAESHTAMLDKLSPYGFSKTSLATCYAMAENTFAVTQSPIGKNPNIDHIDLSALQKDRKAIPALEGQTAVKMVSCGIPIPGTKLRIMNNGNILAEREIGEIAIRSNSMLEGYHRRPTLTADAFQDGWYLTGDMGYLADGELYITGRKKDLIIVGGKNIYPQDLESIANRVEGIYPGRAVAFGIIDNRMGTEGVVMVCELKTNADDEMQYQIEHELRAQIAKSTEIALSDIRLVEQRWVIKTSSGKIARGDNRDKYLKQFRNS